MKKSVKLLLSVCALAFTVLLFSGTESKAAGTISGIKQTSASSSYLEIQWDAYLSSDTVYYATLIGNSATSLTKKESAWGTTDMISGLTEGATYYVQVCAYSDSARSTLVAQSSVIQVTTAMPDVTGLTQTSATTSSISMKWDAVSNATGYKVYRYNSYGNYTAVASTTSTSTTVSGLTASASIPYFVVAYKTTTAGYTAIDDGYHSYTSMKTVSGKVGTLSMTYYWSNLNSGQFGWTSIDNADGYQFQLMNYKGKSLYSTTTTSTSASVDPFKKGIFTKARVRAYITVGNTNLYGAWSSYSYNASSKSVKAKRSSNGKKITLKWSKIKGAVGYRVYISTKNGSGYKKVKAFGKNKKSCTITKCGKKKLKKGKTYYLKVVYLTKVGKKKVASQISGMGSI